MAQRKKTQSKQRPVIICSKNALIFGYTSQPVGSDPITIDRARWAYYWKNDGGHLGLAKTGPQPGSRVGAAGTITLRDIACEIDATEGAAAWESYPVSTR